jgi:hypothetical protein
MAIAPRTMHAKFDTVTEMCQYFMQRHHGDVDAAAKDMEALLHRDKELYDAMVDELTSLAVQERELEYLAGLGQSAGCREEGCIRAYSS